MNQQSAEATTQRTRLVTVTIDGKAKEIERGKYLVSDLKLVLGVPADYELDEVKHGEFKPLDENGHAHIEGGETFVSHVRRGGAS